MASREYSSTDTGAPQMGGNAAGSLLGVLRAVLVDGYGDKQPLGWELMFVDAVNHIHVYRPRSGSRMFLKINDNGVQNNSGLFYASALAYENMFSANNGIHPCPPEQNWLNNECGRILKTGENNVTAQKWRIIGDEEGFFLFTFPYSSRATNYNNVGTIYYFGDYICIGHDSVKNKYNWFMWTASFNNLSNSPGHGYGQASIMRNPYTQTKGSRFVYISSGFGILERGALSGGDDETINGTGNYVSGQSNVNGLPVYSPVYLRDQGYSSYLLGAIPGLFDVVCQAAYKSNQIYYDELDEKNKIVCIPVSSNIGNIDATHLRYGILVGEKFRYVF